MPKATHCKRLEVRGLVQGVGFRASCHREALRIGGLAGWVRNLSNGDVEVFVQGDAGNVERLVDWCRRGPPAGRVKEVSESEAAVDPGLGNFEIR